MRIWLAWLLSVVTLLGSDPTAIVAGPAPKRVCIIPVREPVDEPLLYLVRRGVKQAMDQGADLIVLDMNTPGGKVTTTRKIIETLGEFKGDSVTFVNKDAFSAGAFIAVGTKRIFMTHGSVIGAAAPIIVGPGTGAQAIPDTYEKKMTSAVRAMVRATAEKNGYNVGVIEAMIDKTRGFTIDGKVLVKEGEILTLTNTEAEKEYGIPPRKLLSSGTVTDLDALLKELGYEKATRTEITHTGMESVGAWLNSISWLLVIIGSLGIYLEMKSPGFGIPGLVGIAAFALYFFGGYAAGLSGLEWVVVFIVGIALIAIELFVYPGLLFIGITGLVLILVAIVMALVDLYPNPGPGVTLPRLPSFDAFALPVQQLLIAILGTGVGIWLLGRILPKTTLYHSLVSSGSSGAATEAGQEKQRAERLGQVGTTLSTLRPGGKAQFGEAIVDVMSQGEMLSKGVRVRIIGYSGAEAIVEPVAAGPGSH